MIRALIITILLVVIYWTVPAVKTWADTNYFNYQHRKEVNHLQKLELEGKIEILVPYDSI